MTERLGLALRAASRSWLRRAAPVEELRALAPRDVGRTTGAPAASGSPTLVEQEAAHD